MRKLASLFASCMVLASAQAVGQTPPSRTAQTPQVDCTQLTVDTVTKTATFQLVAGQTGLKSGLNFNGFSDGTLTLTVPQNWNVVIQFTNRDANLPHSAEIVDTTKPMPAGPVDPSFARAMTTKLAQGLTHAEAETFRFVANKPGSYMIFCAVPGHGLAGMWIRLTVSATETRPALRT